MPMERLHIAFFGPANSGKSTLVNALCGQEVSLVSPVPGTTTDPVRKTVELPGLGACVLIDTAGLDDASLLGPERRRRTLAVLDETDIAVVLSPSVIPSEASVSHLLALLESSSIPIVQYTRGESIESLMERLRAVAPKQEERFLTGNLVKAGDCVMLVMPQDSEAPKGRLILPQVQVLRELLDRGCNALCCTPESLASALKRVTPDLVITDSQVFGLVNRALPSSIPLTSFSVLLAGAKGDLRTFVEGASAIDRLQPGDRVLIAEACTHVPDTEDIGRVKIPALLRKKADIKVDIAAGNDFPEDRTPYQLIIHCGGCVATRTLVQSRIKKALRAGVPITNYGIAIAKLQGILERIALP
ncbi:MAG: 50S ribosome-binding GTPase [Bacteroidales bacterium]|nr:50S ribosome-binding GTPase [Bacteroidales bacterium]